MITRKKLILFISIVVIIILIIFMDSGSKFGRYLFYSNTNPFNNNLDSYGLIKVYNSRSDDLKVNLVKEITKVKELDRLRKVLLNAAPFDDNLTECFPLFVLEIFDKNKKNSYLTDLWSCSENDFFKNFVILFREDGTIPGEVRKKATGLKLSKEENEVIKDLFFEKGDVLF